MCFRAFGLETASCSSAEEARSALHKMDGEAFGIIYMTERFCRDLPEELARYSSERAPAVIPIPGSDGNFGIGMGNVEKSVERAVGADILFGGDK